MQIQHMYLNRWSHEIKNSIAKAIDGAKFHGFVFLKENRACIPAAITLKKCCLVVVWNLEGVGIFPV